MSSSDITRADVVLLYLTPEGMRRLKPILEMQVKPAARIVSHDYPIQGVRPAHAELVRYNGESHFIHAYAGKDILRAHSFKVM